MLHPLVRRTWAPRGQTPVLRPRMRRRQKISAVGGLTISPRRRRLGWYLQLHRDIGIRQEQIVGFLRQLRRHLGGPLVVVWDNLGAHKGRLLRAWLRRCRRVHLEFLPPYAPELNPNEYGWAYLKGGPLANACPNDVADLENNVVAAAEPACRHQDLLRAFVRATKLPLRLR